MTAGNKLRIDLAEPCIDFRLRCGAEHCGLHGLQKVFEVARGRAMAEEDFRTEAKAVPK